ncbi:MAG: c-type cytochrome [Armatimonadetes bacterium]|nr:c-type cytochrome [Armatimonadota bacterium]
MKLGSSRLTILLSVAALPVLLVACSRSANEKQAANVQSVPAAASLTTATPQPADLNSTQPSKQASRIRKGALLYAESGCTNCHFIGDKGGSIGTNLNNEGTRGHNLGWQIAHLENPQSKVPGSKMPSYQSLGLHKLRDIALYLNSLGVKGSHLSASLPPVLSPAQSAAAVVKLGARLYAANACANCHKLDGQGGISAPDLTNEAQRGRSIKWLVHLFMHPQTNTPGSTMPSFNSIGTVNLRTLALYMNTLGVKKHASAPNTQVK